MISEDATIFETFMANLPDKLALTQNNVTVVDVLMTVAAGFLIGLFIFFVYRKTFRGVLYSGNFGISLIMLSMITAVLVMCIKSNLLLSLGMVGALSIVRFRTAVKDPLDTVYMFWAITTGIILGAGFFSFAVIAALCMGMLMFVLTFVHFRGLDNYLLVMHFHPSAEFDVMNVLSKLKNAKVKSKTSTRDGVELTMELRMSGDRSDLVPELLSIVGVHDSTLVNYQNETL